MKSSLQMLYRFFSAISLVIPVLLLVAAGQVVAQSQAAADSGDGMWYMLILIGLGALAIAFLLWKRSQKGKTDSDQNSDNRYKNYHRNGNGGFDPDKELRKIKKPSAKSAPLSFEMKQGGRVPSRPGRITATNSAGIDEDAMLDTKAFQEKMRKLQYAQLPINSFLTLQPAKKYQPLETSYDETLLDAIDQASDEYEEDENVREIAVRVLAAFKTQNSVEAVSQIALYDLAASLRSKAVSVLTEYDHESVFEPLLLACADPTREVRASAARGLFRLNFDRSDAWKRIIETNDEFLMRQAARAATEAGLVTKAFERLIHDDLKVAYEAFVLVSLMVKAGETQEVFDAIKYHKDERVKYALLHVIKVLKEEHTLAGLNELQMESEKLPPEVGARVRDAIGNFSHVTA